MMALAPEGLFYYNEADSSYIPHGALPFRFYRKGSPQQFISLDYWMLDNTGVPPFPDERTRIMLARQLCRQVKRPAKGWPQAQYQKPFQPGTGNKGMPLCAIAVAIPTAWQAIRPKLPIHKTTYPNFSTQNFVTF